LSQHSPIFIFISSLLLKFYSSLENKNFFFSPLCRRRKGNKLFLVAFYECDDDYELENLEQDRLYCSRERWVGDAPKCMQIHEDEGEEEGGSEENGE
jgi:hypothetical protein